LGWYDNIVIVVVGIELVERRVLCEREVLSTRAFWIVRSSAGCEDQPCSWVCTGRGEKERRREKIC
jgi:hypothetical protein